MLKPVLTRIFGKLHEACADSQLSIVIGELSPPLFKMQDHLPFEIRHVPVQPF